ncbi:zinc finger protein 462-like [Limanda limanda]|uniref:zinc finger protein 462-like n=1 Tax=Limanda limanda TaxID=27771 RepID=UPI0029C6F112|nr:zinc finger protein 462-like [Limanda limanda]
MPRQPVSEESSVKSFCCSDCSLVFPSKVSLFQHVSLEHGQSDEDDAESNRAESITLCHSCGFIARSQDELNDHEKQCGKKPEKQNQTGNPIVPGSHESGIGAVMSTSKSPCMLNSSKDLKTYKGPLQMQTITKFLTAQPRPPSVKSAESPVSLSSSATGTLLLQQSPSDLSPNSSGVFKVTAMSAIDMTCAPSNNCMVDNHFLISELRSHKPKGQSNDPVYENSRKRSSRGRWESQLAKKTKTDEEETELPGNEDASKPPPGSTDFSFEISDDEQEKKVKLRNRDVEIPNTYFCKHCDYSDAVIRLMSFHYQNDHPYIRCSATYIQDPSDQSVTFRCLECPIEFLAEAQLQGHYTEKHPDAPKVFMMHSCELVYKCFVCKFISNELKALTEHYKEEHPTHKADDSLLYCKYTAPVSQEGSSELNTCRKTHSPETSGGISPKNADAQPEEIKSAPSPLHTTSSREDVVLYHCSSCIFSHKSAVGMHVHYQKKHPDEMVTINKIKQSASVSSQTSSQATAESSSNVMENSVPQRDASGSPETEKSKAEVSQEKFSSPLTSPKNTTDTSKTHSESPKIEKVKTEADAKITKRPLSKWNRELSSGIDCSSSSSLDKTFYCQFCTFSNTNIRSVVAHHNMKHVEHGLTGTEEVWWYNNKLQKKKLQSEAETSTGAESPHSKSSERVEGWKERKRRNEETTSKTVNPYERVDDLFYCQVCNSANVSLKGIMSHQTKVHTDLSARHEPIIKHTALIRADIKRSQRKDSSSFRLPLPLMNEGDMDCFFCHFCNYRHNSATQVLRHYMSRHPGFKIKNHQILQYTSTLFKQMEEESHPETSASREDSQEKVTKKKKVKTLAKCSSASVSAPQTQRTLKCYRCTYSCQTVSLLRRHMLKVHKTNRSITDILRVCYRQGMLESGYHCDRCVFFHKSAAVVFQHIQQQHPNRKASLEYVSTRLYVGPDSFIPKRKEKHKKTHTGDGRAGQSETKRFSCKACSFIGNSISSITSHCSAVHPWSVKDNSPVLKIIASKKSSPQIADDHTEIPESFDSYQVPLGRSDSPDSSDEAADCSNWFKCKHCTAWFSTWHGLNTHSGMKHPDAQIDGTAHVHVFKCPHCPYINASYHGVITHCQTSHPDSESSADSHFMDEMHLRSWNQSLTKKGSDDTKRFSGYICETCPQISATLKKLNKHCETEHNQTDPNTVLKPSAARKRHQPHTYSSLGSVSKASVLQKKKYPVIKCQVCSYKCSTKIGIARHTRLNHRHSSYRQDFVFKCALCPKLYSAKRHLARHYTNKHGKHSLSKYFAPVYQQVKALKSPDCPSTQQPENTSESSATREDGKIIVFKCPACPYVNSSYHGTLTHCQMMHPTLVVRADRLQTDTILESQLVHSWTGKGSKHKGFMCKRCPLIYASLSQLEVHREMSHGQAQPAASEPSVETETEKQPDHSSGGSTSEDSSLKIESSPVSTIKPEHDQQLVSPESLHVSLQNKEMLYECDLCSYAGICRKYLHCHYKNMHKMDGLSISKQLERYNKRKHLMPKVPSEESVHCKKCPQLLFDTSQLLIVHYTNFHSSNFKMDFTVLKRITKVNPGVFKCDHCSKHVVGIRKLCHHLERHEAAMKTTAMDAKPRASVAMPTTPETPTNEICRQDEPPMFEPEQDLTHWNVTPVKTLTLQTGSLPSPSGLTDPELPEESMEDKRTCRQCGRSFMSLRGLRSHQRSHAALAAMGKLDKLSSSLMKHNIDEYVAYKPGTLRPFLCNFCTFRTTVFGLWRSHFIRKHQDVYMNDVETENEDEENSQRNNQDPPPLSEENSNLPEPDEEVEITERSMYLEPPDVQRQLNHYSLMAQTGRAARAERHETKLPESCLLHCELCSFSTGHVSSVRRHYLNRHGKKILKCKDCEFFTWSKKTLEMHMEAGHSTFQSEPTHLRDLRCPLCLYQTRNKNNMIDHIVLHREERVVPIEVRRPKLSRYLQGIVFRCHKCTFSCGSAENLRLHITKHDDVKPYKCRLCYFDCTLLSDLEAHLSDKHQVERNHELVGQVSLDQLEAQDGRIEEEEEEEKEDPLSNSEQHNSTREDVKIRLVSGCKEVKHETLVADPAEDNLPKQVTEQLKEACLKHDQETAREQTIKPTVEQNVTKGNSSESEESDGSERERQTNENQAQLKVRGSEDNSAMSPGQREEAAERDSATCDEMVDKKESKLSLRTLQHRKSAIESRAEDKILRHILVLDEDGSLHKTHNKGEPERRVKKEQSRETKVLDNVLSELLDEECKMSLAHEMTTKYDSEEKKSHMQGNNLRTREDLNCGSPSRTPLPVCVQLNEESSGLSLTNCKEELVSQQEHVEEPSDPYGDMPVLENEYLKETSHPQDCCKEEEEDELEQPDKGDEAMTEDDESGCKDREHEEGDGTEEANSPRVGKSGVTAAGGASEVPRPSVTENKLFTCELCGRNLVSGSDLKRHIMRHGM